MKALRYSLPFVLLAALPVLQRSGAIDLMLPVLLAVFLGLDATLGDQGRQEAGDVSLAYRLLPRLYIPLQLGILGWGAVVASRTAAPAPFLALAAASGVVSGIFGMLAAHDAIHSRHPLDRALGLAMLAPLWYMHFSISHLQGHHRHAATLRDPATARRGESVYRFFVRSILGQWREAWALENARIERRRLQHSAHRVARYVAIEGALTLVVAAALGWRGLLYQGVVATIAVLILELFNYVAHYGLLRQELPAGSVESLRPQHSWNTPRRFNNWALFNGGHHSDHHLAPTRAYQRLRAVPATPQLPFGYAGSLMLALAPPLWRRVMERRLDAAPSPGAPRASLSPRQPGEGIAGVTDPVSVPKYE